MSRKKIPQYCYTILCEDVRLEILNKITLAGVYKDLIYVKDLPATLNRLAFYQTYHNMDGEYSFKYELHSPENKVLASAGILITDPGAGPLAGVAVAFGNAQLNSAGKYKLVTKHEKDDHFQTIATYNFDVILKEDIFEGN